MFIDFFYTMKNKGLPVTLQQVLEFYDGLEKGLATDIDKLFIFSRLVFVKKLEHYHSFEKAFISYFYGVESLDDLKDPTDLIESKPFKEWLDREVANGNIGVSELEELSYKELIEKFWETALEQVEAHHGGGLWIGTGGYSAFGHSGTAIGGIRIHGESRNLSASKVIGEERYINYDSSSTLKSDNIRQALSALKKMVPKGPETMLNIDETIYQTAKNGGEIEFAFERELRDKIKVLLLLDNGGSMWSYSNLVKLVFSKIENQFKDLKTYYFHNCIYGSVFYDQSRRKKVSTNELLKGDLETRVLIIGDASMAPEELFRRNGAISWNDDDLVPGLTWLKRIKEHFPYSIWLNPTPKHRWDDSYGGKTRSAIRKVFHMEDLTLNGIKNTVEYLKPTKF